MSVTQDNPLGLDGFAFVEFTSPDPAAMKALFEQMGFVAASTHPTKAVTRYKQGRINLLVNDEPTGQVAEFRAAHGPSANGMAFGVADVEQAYAEALKRGADANARVAPRALLERRQASRGLRLTTICTAATCGAGSSATGSCRACSLRGPTCLCARGG